MAPTYFRVGKWLVRPSENALIQGDDIVTVEPRAMDVLCSLAGANGAVVSTEELLLRCWPGTFLGDAPVHKVIAQLRRAVGDSPTAATFIATIRKRGYRLVSPIQFPDGYAGRITGPRSTWTRGNPFRGLEPFGLEHAPVFFGRTRTIAAVLGALRMQAQSGCRFVFCVGASGVGKTSLLEAGVASFLLRTPNFEGWRALAACRASMTGDDPFDALARAFLALALDGRGLYFPTELEDLRQAMSAAPDRIVESLAWRLKSARRGGDVVPGIVLIVDEMEGLIRERVDAPGLVRTLGVLAESPHCAVLSACRSDGYGPLSDLAGLMALKGSFGHVDVSLPTAGELGAIQREPAALAGLQFERDPVSGERLDDVLREAAFRHPECLPVLQHALAQLYEQRTSADTLSFASYRAMGGLTGALARQAERVFARLPESARAALPRLLGRVVLLSGDEMQPRSQPVRRAQLSDDERILCDAFVAARLFVSDDAHGHAVVRPAHDALLRHWRRAADWVEHNRAMLSVRTRIRASAAHWNAHERSRDLLLPDGLPLEEARALLESTLPPLDPGVRALIAASLARFRRRLWLRRALTVLMAGLAIGASTAGCLAIRAQRAAERQGAEAERLVAFMLGDLSHALQPLGQLDILDHAATAVTKYLQGTSHERATDQVTRHRAEALLQMAYIRTGQGKDEEALKDAEDARALLAPLLQARDVDASSWKAAGTAAYWIGYLNYRARRIGAATRAWREYNTYSAAWLASAPDDANALLEHSYAINNLAVLARDRGDLRAAAEQFGESAALKRRVLATRPDDRVVAADLADSESWQASALASIGEFQAAGTIFRAALARVIDVRKRAPEEALWTYREATLRMNMALLETDQGRMASAAKMLDRARILLAGLREHDPGNRDWHRDALFVRQELAWNRWLAGDRASVPEELACIARSLRELRARNPTNVEWRRLEAVVLERRAVALLRTGSVGAEVAARKAVALMGMDRAANEPGGDGLVRVRAALVLGDVLRARMQERDALWTWYRALDELAALPGNDSDVAMLDVAARLNARTGNSNTAQAIRSRLDAIGFRRPRWTRIANDSKGEIE
jgi:DNA-binding winged helix-turn-helix (wHTH) protein/tetratricopeptide (TPR) repeat protein